MVGFAGRDSADVVTTDPSLPPVVGAYLTPAQVHADYSGPGLQIVLSQIQHQPFAGQGTIVQRHSDASGNETEIFGSSATGMVSVNGSPDVPINATGPVTTEVFGKVGNVTGTFNTEMLQLDLSGNTPFGPMMIRESPTLASTGQTTITDIGGGQYRISSFFDIFTELSVDGGASWIPQNNGPTHVVLTDTSVPLPAALPAGLGLLGLLIVGRRRRAV